MRIVLVAVHPAPSPQSVPLANAFLQSYLTTVPQAKAVETLRVDFYLDQSPAACVAEIVNLQPAAVGFSMYLWNRTTCRDLAARLRGLLAGASLFAGGPEATADPAGVLAESDYDFLICGEGEVPFAAVSRRLAEGGAVADIPGIAVRSGNSFSLIPAVPLDNLDSIPSPWLNGILDARHYPGILWQLSRGCSFTCDFCFDSRGSHGVRRFSLERLEAELRYFATHDVSQVFVLDSTFNQERQRAKQILRLIRKTAPLIHFHFEVRSEFIDAEMAELFAGISCSLQIGLQSADPAVLKKVGRLFRPDDFVSRTMLLNRSGAVFGFDLIYGLPGDTLAGFQNSLDFALGLYPNHLDIFPLAVLPGTALADRTASNGLQHLPVPPYTLTASPTFSAADMREAQRLAAACDIFYTRGRAVAWFNGMLEVLGQRPAAFLREFAQWLEKDHGGVLNESDLTDCRVWGLQRAFLAIRFDSKRLRRFRPALFDLVDYHYHYASALLTPPAQPPAQKQNWRRLLQAPLRLAASTRLTTFSYEILDILEAGAADLRSISDNLQATGSWAIIYPTAEGVCTESVSETYYHLLQGLDGRSAAGEVAGRLGIPDDEAASFLEFAIMDGVVQH